MSKSFEKLQKLREFGGKTKATGLSDSVITKFLKSDPKLAQAIDEAYDVHNDLQKEYGDLLRQDEDKIIQTLQQDFLNFYAKDAINPYVPLAARGPWIISTKGAVLHDSGGYGMLGFGHAPQEILKRLEKPYVMANVMTASFTQGRFIKRLTKEIGHRNKNKKPFAKFVCINSGSEAVTFAARLSDINAKLQTDAGGKQAGKKIMFLALAKAFHGRTDRPAQFSDSSLPSYRKHLASFANRDNLRTVTPNDCAELKAAFEQADKDNIYFEAMFMEPVMGEGNPGEAVTPEFYKMARELTKARKTLLVVDSIQAGLRAHGCLSILDYPGFENAEAPDVEVYSKALNAGQYPLSIVAMQDWVAGVYKTGVYGNTMTTNPRALEVACAVLDSLNADLRKNIEERGKEIVTKLVALGKRFPNLVGEAKGTGLLCSVAINESKLKVEGAGGLEEHIRLRGVGVIHGGKNALRFTPHFRITSEEIDLVINTIADVLSQTK